MLATRRMISKDVSSTDVFLDMPKTYNVYISILFLIPTMKDSFHQDRLCVLSELIKMI